MVGSYLIQLRKRGLAAYAALLFRKRGAGIGWGGRGFGKARHKKRGLYKELINGGRERGRRKRVFKKREKYPLIPRFLSNPLGMTD